MHQRIALVVSLAFVTTLTAQRRVHTYTVTDLGDGSNVILVRAFNSSASMLITEQVLVGGQPTQVTTLRRLDGSRVTLPLAGLDMNDAEQVCGDREVPGVTIKGFVWDAVQGVRDIAGYGHQMHAPFPETRTWAINNHGLVVSAQWQWFDAAGNVQWIWSDIPFASAATTGTFLVDPIGVPNTFQVWNYRAGYYGSGFAHDGSLLITVAGAPSSDTWLMSPNGSAQPVIRPLAHSFFLTNRGEVLAVGNGGYKTLGPANGPLDVLSANVEFAAKNDSINSDGDFVGVDSARRLRGWLSLRPRVDVSLTFVLHNRPSWTIVDAWGINDHGQIAATATDSAGNRRIVVLAPTTTPTLGLEFESSTLQTNPNTGSVRHRVTVDQNNRTPVRIVGGYPGQPGAMFLNLGGTHHYLDGTLGVFDGDQQFTFSLPIPPAVYGLEFDVAAAALDPQLGILRSQDLPIRL